MNFFVFIRDKPTSFVSSTKVLPVSAFRFNCFILFRFTDDKLRLVRNV